MELSEKVENLRFSIAFWAPGPPAGPGGGGGSTLRGTSGTTDSQVKQNYSETFWIHYGHSDSDIPELWRSWGAGKSEIGPLGSPRAPQPARNVNFVLSGVGDHSGSPPGARKIPSKMAHCYYGRKKDEAVAQGSIAMTRRTYPMLRTSASGQEIGLSSQISAGF